MNGGCVRSSSGKLGLGTAILSHNDQLVPGLFPERERPGQRDSSRHWVDGEQLSAVGVTIAVVDQAEVDLAVDSGVGIFSPDSSEDGVQRGVFRHVEEVGGRLEEGIQVVGIGHLDVDNGLGFRCSDPTLIRAFGTSPYVQLVRGPAFAVQDVQVVRPGPEHEENEVSDTLSLGLEKVVLVAGFDPVTDVDG